MAQRKNYLYVDILKLALFCSVLPLRRWR